MALDYILWGNELSKYLWFVIFIIIGFIISWIIVFISRKVLFKFAKRTKNKIDDILSEILSKPLPFQLIIVTIFFNIGFKLLTVSGWWVNFISKLSLLIYVFGITLFVIKFLLGLIKEYFEVYAAKTKSKYDDQLIPLLKTAIRLVVWAIAILLILSNFGYNISALLAGLGIGGLAIAMASKDIVENFLSGIVIFVEKPFKIGDIVKTSEGTGIIHEVGIRSTKVKTFDGTIVIVPNNKISNNAVENISVRKTRKESFTIGVTYDTSSAKLSRAKKIINDILKANKAVDNTFYITFKSFGDFSLHIKVIYYITELDYNKYLNVIDMINTDIKKQFEKEKIEMAFPTQTIELKK